jgi:tetratricopeptide (TPR) repeat protein
VSETIPQEAGRRAGRLPLLQFALAALWTRQLAGEISHAAYDDPVVGIGGLDGALRRHAEEVYRDLGRDSKGIARQERVRRLFRRLVQHRQGGNDIRRIVPRAEVENDWNEIVVELANARLVTTSESSPGIATVEVIHEELLRAWPDLSRWISENREFDLWREDLTLAATRWSDAPETEKVDLLLRGRQLDKALVNLRERRSELTPKEVGYIEAARQRSDRELEGLKEADRRKLRNTRLVAATMTALALIAVATSIASLWSLNELSTQGTQLETASEGYRLQLSAEAQRAAGDINRALESATAAKRIFDNLVRSAPKVLVWQRDQGAIYSTLGDVQSAKGARDLALESYRGSLGIRYDLAKSHESNLNLRRELAMTHNKIGELLATMSRFDEAIASFTESLHIAEMAFPDEVITATFSANLANIYISLGSYPEALRRLSHSAEIQERALGPAHPALAHTLNTLAGLYYSLGRYSDAELVCIRSVRIRQQVFGSDHLETVRGLKNLADILAGQARYSEAEPLYERALTVFEKRTRRRPSVCRGESFKCSNALQCTRPRA